MGEKGAKTIEKLGDQISVLKYVLSFWNVLIWMIALACFAIAMWLRFEEGLGEWIRELKLEEFYIGTYILIIASVLMLITPFLACVVALSEQKMLVYAFIGSQVLGFILATAGSCVILEYSTQNSQIQPMIRESMRRLIMNAQHEESKQTLAMIQETIGCCGADGAIDYTSLHQPLPSQCRDTVTGNPYFHGCVDELSWFFSEKTSWLTGLAMILCFMSVLNIAFSLVLMMALRKEREVTQGY